MRGARFLIVLFSGVLLDLDAGMAARPHGIEHLAQRRDGFVDTAQANLAQFSQRQRRNRAAPMGGIVERRIMDDDEFVVGRQMDVEFDLVGALLDGGDKGRQRIFRPVGGAAAMGDDLGTSHRVS